MAVITVDFDGTLYQQNSIVAILKAGKTTFTIKQWTSIIKEIIKGIARKRRYKF